MNQLKISPWLMAGALTMTAAAAVADEENSDQKPKVHTKVVVETETDSEGLTEEWRVPTTDGTTQTRSVQVTVNGDDISVILDGEEVPQERIRRTDEGIEVLNAQGEVIHTVPVFTTAFPSLPGAAPLPPTGFGFTFGDEPFMQLDHERWTRITELLDEVWSTGANPGDLEVGSNLLVTPQAEPPGVMLGIYLEDPGPALRKHLQIEEGRSTLITGVFEGLAAEEAGIEPYDIIIAIDGDNDADPQAVREALRHHEPGDTVELKLLQAGEARTVTVELDAYDAQRMESAQLLGRTTEALRQPHDVLVAPLMTQRADGMARSLPQIITDRFTVASPKGTRLRLHGTDGQELEVFVLPEGGPGRAWINALPQVEGEVRERMRRELETAKRQQERAIAKVYGAYEQKRKSAAQKRELIDARMQELTQVLEKLQRELADLEAELESSAPSGEADTAEATSE